jgi:hypothetical protein
VRVPGNQVASHKNNVWRGIDVIYSSEHLIDGIGGGIAVPVSESLRLVARSAMLRLAANELSTVSGGADSIAIVNVKIRKMQNFICCPWEVGPYCGIDILKNCVVC